MGRGRGMKEINRGGRDGGKEGDRGFTNNNSCDIILHYLHKKE